MSDDEYYSDNNSESEDSENEEINTTIPIKFRPPNSINIQNNDVDNDSDVESDENESDEDSVLEDDQFGGAIEEADEVENDDDSDPE